MKHFVLAGVLSGCIAQSASAGLGDDFIYSSKFGLLTESVTDSWTSEDTGLTFGGVLNGIPRDSWQDLYFYNGKLSFVRMGYELEPLVFETEQAYRRWVVKALSALIKKAEKRYGTSTDNTINCSSDANDICSGYVVWRGSNKVFEIRADEQILAGVLQSYFGIKNEIRFTYSYADASDYDLMAARLPSLITSRNKRSIRRYRNILNQLLKTVLAREKQTLDEYLSEGTSAQSEINAILRDTAIDYVGGVKANYTPERWVRSFRLQ